MSTLTSVGGPPGQCPRLRGRAGVRSPPGSGGLATRWACDRGTTVCRGHRGAARRLLPWSGLIRSSAAVVALAVCCVLGTAQPALAHTSLVSTSPAADTVIVDAVEVVTLVFTQPVSPDQVQVVVTGPGGVDVMDGPIRVSGGSVNRSVGAWTASGTHRLAYRVLAEDGHPITGEVSFGVAPAAVGPAPTGSPTTTSVPTATAGPGQAPSSAPRPVGTNVALALVTVLGAVAVLLVVGAVRAGRHAGAGR